MSYTRMQGQLLPEGWLKEFLRRDKEGITGNLDKLFRDCAEDVFGADKVTHKEDGYWSSWWAGETHGNWIEAYVRLAFLTGEEELVSRARAIVENILAHQGEDGYIGIYVEGARYIVTKRFGELWAQSRAMRTLLVYYDYTKEERVLSALVRMADNIVENTPENVFLIPDEDGSKGHSLMIIDGMYALYSLTGKEAYRDFSVRLYEDYCAHRCQFLEDDLRTENLLDPLVPFTGHGPHTCEMLRLPLLLYRMTGEKNYLIAFRCALNKLSRNLSLSGSCKSDEFIGTYQSELVMENDARTSVFGGSVPLPTAAYEYCSTAELALDYIRAEHILGDISFGEKLEWLVYNAGLASKHPSGKMIQYFGADNMYDASHAVNPRFDYSPTHDDAAVCCAPNACKLMPVFAREAYLTDGETLICNLFLPSSFRFSWKEGELVIAEKTEYPFRCRVEFECAGEGSVPFALRLPSFAERYTLTKNGKPCRAKEQNGLLFVEGGVSGGDKLTFSFEPRVRMLRAPDGTFALAWGTLLFSKDIPASCKRYRKYEGAEGFYDCDFTPKPHEDWNDTLFVTEEGDPVAHVEYCRGGYPTEKPPVAIVAKALDRYAYPVDLRLVPIGATTLRRTTFPVFYDERGIYAAAMKSRKGEKK